MTSVWVCCRTHSLPSGTIRQRAWGGHYEALTHLYHRRSCCINNNTDWVVSLWKLGSVQTGYFNIIEGATSEGSTPGKLNTGLIETCRNDRVISHRGTGRLKSSHLAPIFLVNSQAIISYARFFIIKFPTEKRL